MHDKSKQDLSTDTVKGPRPLNTMPVGRVMLRALLVAVPYFFISVVLARMAYWMAWGSALSDVPTSSFSWFGVIVMIIQLPTVISMLALEHFGIISGEGSGTYVAVGVVVAGFWSYLIGFLWSYMRWRYPVVVNDAGSGKSE